VRAGGKQLVLWDRHVEVPGGKPRVEEGVAADPPALGRLRMKRAGATLLYLWAPGAAGGDFQEVHHCEFGTEDIKHVDFYGVTGRQPCNLDARLLEVRIGRAGGQAQPVAATEMPRGTWKVGLAAALLVPVAGLGVWFLVRRSRVARKPTGTPAEGNPAPAEAAERILSFPCPGCSRPLKARAQLAGKKVKCPHCQEGVLVPARGD
jgi:hypothetical protein